MQVAIDITNNNDNNICCHHVPINEELMCCKCSICSHDSRADCINSRCYCRNLEDIFAILAQMEFESQSKIVTREMLDERIS